MTWTSVSLAFLVLTTTTASSGCSSDIPVPPPALPVDTIQTASATLAIDGCSAPERSNCNAFGSGCLNGLCSAGQCPTLQDGCSAQQRSSCNAFECSCENGQCGFGACPPIPSTGEASSR